MTDVLMIPDWRGGNPYLTRLAEGIEQAGVHVRFDDPPEGYFKLTRLLRHHRDVQAVHIHWLPPLLDNLLWSRRRTRVLAKLGLFAADILLCRAMGKRVVWTIHNLVSHESSNPIAETKARRILLRLCHAAITHSPEAKAEVQKTLNLDYGRKMHVIPHGHYLDDYIFNPDSYKNLRNRIGITEDNFVILFFGNIRPYKGLEDLLDAFSKVDRPEARLVIAGRPFSDDLKTRVEEATRRDPRITADLTFIPDEDVASYFHLADVVLLPFRRTLTSGSVILAMGFGKTLILPGAGRSLGLKPNENAFFYSTNEELRSTLRNLTKSYCQNLGKDNLEMVSENTWGSIGAQTITTYAQKANHTFLHSTEKAIAHAE